MSALWLDVEVYGDREAELEALYAELAEEDALPDIIQDEGPDFDFWGEAA